MDNYNTSKRIIAGILIYSHSLMSCYNLTLNKENLNKVEEGRASTEGQHESLVKENEKQQLTIENLALTNDQAILGLQENNFALRLSCTQEATVAQQPIISNSTPFNTSQELRNKTSNLIAVHALEHKKCLSKLSPLGHQRALGCTQPRSKQPRQQELIGTSFTLKAGQEVSFYQEKGALKAKIQEGWGELSRNFKLPVYISSLHPGKTIQPRHVYLITPEQDVVRQGVYIGQVGLMGGMYNPPEDKDSSYYVDSEPEGFSSDEDDGIEDPSKEVPTADDSSRASDGYQEALEFERKIKKRLEEVSRQRGLRLSKVNLIEKQLADIKKAGKISKQALHKIKKEVEQKIDFVLNWDGKPTNTIKCKSCKRQMRVDKDMLFHINGEIFGSGNWGLCDEYGNRKPDSPVYHSLAAIMAAYDTKIHFVCNCVYCYKDKEIAYTEKSYTRSKQEYEKLSQDYRKEARRTNRSISKEKSIQKKLAKQEGNIKLYKATFEALREAAIAMEELRKKAIIDYEGITYGGADKHKQSEEED